MLYVELRGGENRRNKVYPSKTHLNLKSRVISFMVNIHLSYLTVLQICTDHGSGTAVHCAKLKNDRAISYRKRYFTSELSSVCWILENINPVFISITLYWRHNERHGVPNHRRLDYLLKRLLKRRSKETWKLRVTGHCEGNPPVSTSNTENVSFWWSHHELQSNLTNFNTVWRPSWYLVIATHLKTWVNSYDL